VIQVKISRYYGLLKNGGIFNPFCALENLVYLETASNEPKP